jgi:fatty acid desaturase
MTIASISSTFTSDDARLRSFGSALDALKERVESQLGAFDVRYVKSLELASRSCEALGRLLIHFSFEPIAFSVGVIFLWLHKQLQAIEIGHTSLHGAYDKFADATRFHSKSFSWDIPIDEESWRYGHNARHHGATNVAGKDADVHFGPIRLTKEVEHTGWQQRLQIPFALFILFPNFTFLMNLHFTGVNDLLEENGVSSKYDFIDDRSAKSAKKALGRAARKYAPYYLKEYVFFPALAGPFFWKVMLGNYLAGLLRDLYSAATIFCGHIGPDVASYPEGTKTRHRGEWFAMQVESTNNFDVSLPVSVLCGGLDHQIEHHLFPRLPPHRLRQIAPEVRAICDAHGVRYHSASWGRILVDAFKHLDTLSRPNAPTLTSATVHLTRELA